MILAHKITLEPSHDPRVVQTKAAGCARAVYKLPLHGGTFIAADRFSASSKICSGCGTIKKNLSLKHRIFTCDTCSLYVNRDLNAVFNLRTLALRETNARRHCVRPIVDSSIVATVVETRIEIMRNYAHI